MIDIWLFVPLGTGLCKVYQKKWVLLIPFIMSVAIEMTQYITGLGIAELDDVFGNTVGGWIGVFAAYVALKRKGKESWTGLRCIILEDCYKMDFNLFM